MGSYEQFSPCSSAVGGIFIGLSSSILLHQAGRWTGASSICRRALSEPLGQWQQTWIAGAMSAMLLSRTTEFSFLKAAQHDASRPMSLVEIAIGSILIGFGTTVGCGCTSGHGVMGVPRFSPRSLVATGTFMGLGIFAATFLQPLLPSQSGEASFKSESFEFPSEVSWLGSFGLFAVALWSFFKDVSNHVRAAATTFLSGLGFGTGLIMSGMTSPAKIKGFLDVAPLINGSSSWDPSMLVVFVSAVATNFVTMNLWLIPKGTEHHDGQVGFENIDFNLCGETIQSMISKIVFFV